PPRGGLVVRFASALLFMALSVGTARASDIYSPADVVDLHRSGVGETMLVELISNGVPFVVSLADIQYLRAEGVSDRVISALVRHGVRPGDRHTGERIESGATVVVAPAITTIVPIIVTGDDDHRGR